jgi:hypothetical protein
MYYSRDGRPISFEEVLELVKSDRDRRVAETTLPDGTWVSTVWLTLDHRMSGEGGPPLIFETMVFVNAQSLESLDMERYATEEQALAGHVAMVAKWSHLPVEDALPEAPVGGGWDANGSPA